MNSNVKVKWNNTRKGIVVSVWIVNDCMYFSKDRADSLSNDTSADHIWIVLESDERITEGMYCYHVRWNSKDEAIEWDKKRNVR